MNIKPIQTFNEAWHFFIKVPPMPWYILFIFWWYCYLWILVDIHRPSFNIYGIYQDKQLISMCCWKGKRIYYMGTLLNHRGRGYTNIWLQYTKCNEFRLTNPALKDMVIKKGFVRQHTNLYRREE